MAADRFSPGCDCCGGPSTQVCAEVAECSGGSYVASSGATVTVRDSTNAVVGTCTTNGLGRCCVTVPGAGTYTVSASKGGNTSKTETVVVAAGGTGNAVLFVQRTRISFTVSNATPQPVGVSNTIDGASVTATQGLVTVSGTTDANGQITLDFPSPGTWNFTISRARYATSTFSRLLNCGTTTNLAPGLDPGAGYYAFTGARHPIAGTLYLSINSCGGTSTLSFAGIVGSLTAGWYGCCSATGGLETYFIPPKNPFSNVPGGLNVGFTLGSCPSSGGTNGSYQPTVTSDEPFSASYNAGGVIYTLSE